MNTRKVIKKGRFKFEQVFVFPGDVHNFINDTIGRLNIDKRTLCHLACGSSEIGGLRIDIIQKKFEVEPDIVADILHLPFRNNSIPNILADLPWAIPFGARRHFSYAMRDVLAPGGILIINSPWDPWCTGLTCGPDDSEIWKVRQSFNSYRDLVDFWIFRKEN